MKKVIHLVAVCLFTATISMAQEVPGAVDKQKKGCGCSYSSLYNIGIMEGEATTKFQLQTVQGIRYGKWFSGVGVGLDYYHTRTIPLFLDIRRELSSRTNSPFIYADGGISFAWANDNKNAWEPKSDFSNGPFYDLGLGYRVAVGKGSFLLSAGYSYKYIKETRTQSICATIWCEQTTESREYYRYRLNRLSLKLGMQL